MLYSKCKEEGREPHEWELKNTPPLPPSPAEIRAKILSAKANKAAGFSYNSGNLSPGSLETAQLDGQNESGGANGPQPDNRGGGGATEPACGFYRVVRNGAWIWGLTNGTVLSGTVSIPIEVGHDGGTLEAANLQANFTSVLEVDPPQSFSSLPLFMLDTTRLRDGDNYLSAEAVWNLSTSTNADEETWPDYLIAQSPYVQVVISNEIFFPNWLDDFGGSSLSFDVETKYIDADWQIDIYDSQTNYVGSFSDHTTDGRIHVVWGVTNAAGIPLNDDVFYSATTVTYATPNGPANIRKPNPRKIKVADNYPPVGQWIVAWQNVFQDNPETYKNQPGQPNMLNSIFAAYTAAQSGGSMILPLGSLPGSFQPLRFGTNFTTTQKTQDWTQFKVALTNLNARNLYYMGHGSAKALGASKNPALLLTSKEVGTLLRYDDSNPTNRHFFRYVFLDGCNTANGSFPTRFGIPKKEHVLYGDYLEQNIRPRAFSGWTAYKQYAVLGNIPWQFPAYRINFWFYWSQGSRSLLQSHQDAKTSVPGAPSFRIGDSLKIYGYEDMRFYDFNTQ